MIQFNTLLKSAGIDPANTRLLRHSHRSRQAQLYQDAIRQHPRFEEYQSSQSNPNVIDQMNSAEILASFVVDPGGRTVFVGLWRVKGSKEDYIADPYGSAPRGDERRHVVFELEWQEVLEHYRGRIVVDWGGGERAWLQYAHRRDKEIVEIRRIAEEPLFPGVSRFTSPLHQLESLPATWLESLRVTRGIYILVHRTSGAQYVGSATGPDGFLGRWRGYTDGHGGNAALRELGHQANEYDVRILETVGSGASLEDVYELESAWKDKLGSRAQGLNRN